MQHVSTDINTLIRESRERKTDPDFPNAPPEWTRDEAIRIAREEGLELDESHFAAIRAMQDYYAAHGDDTFINLRDLHDALDECFERTFLILSP